MKDSEGNNHYAVAPFVVDEAEILIHGTVLHPSMDDEDNERDEYSKGYREAGVKAVDHWKGVFSAMLTFKGDARFVIRCTIAAHGFWDLLPHRDQVEIAAHFGCERANVNKLVKLIQKRLGLPPTLGQRSVDGCQNMSKTRKSQLVEQKQIPIMKNINRFL